jgi:hypothetical protein
MIHKNINLESLDLFVVSSVMRIGPHLQSPISKINTNACLQK